MFNILSVSRNTRRLIERNDILALSGFRVVSPRTPEEAPFLAVQQNVDAVVIGRSVDSDRRKAIIAEIRRLCPGCIVIFVYHRPNDADEPLADASIDVTSGSEPLVNELRARLWIDARQSVPLLREFLHAAIEASGADFGNIQLLESSTQTLRIAAQHGFNQEFLRFFEVVHGTDTACGSALSCGSRVIVEDVATDAIFRGKASGEMMLRANACAVQSTPLIGGSGQLIGIVSTHYRESGSPAAKSLLALDRIVLDYVSKMEKKPIFRFQPDLPLRKRA